MGIYRRLRLPLILIASTLVALGLAGTLTVAYLLHKAWPEALSCDLTVLSQAQQPMMIYGADGSVLGSVVSDNRMIIPLSQVSPHLINAVTAAEDKNFFTNWGFDLHGTARALVADFRHKRVVQGGSTITQQLAKHMIDERGRSLRRKLVELEVAWRLTHTYSKERILELYLNEVYWGSGFYGIEAASQGYFHVHASELNDAQSAILAGLIRAPNANSPFRNLSRATGREHDVLLQMKGTDKLSEEAYQEALREPLNLQTPRPPKGLDSYAIATVDHAVDDLIASGAWFQRQGADVKVTFLPTLQHWAERQSVAYLSHLRQVTSLPLQGSLLVLDNETGGVLAETGGFSYQETSFDRNWNMRRPGGTMLYPWLLTAALRDGNLSPASMMDVRPVTPATVNPASGMTTSLPLQDLVSVSDPGGMLRLASMLGTAGLANTLAARTDQEVAAIGQGARPLSPPEIALLFASLARQGKAHGLHCLEVIGHKGLSPYQIPSSPEITLMPPMVANQVAATLAAGSAQGMPEVVDPGANHDISYGGFSINGHDAWYAGTDGHITTVAWIGCDQPASLPAGTDLPHLAYPLWKAAMEETRKEAHLADTPLTASTDLAARIIRRANGATVIDATTPVAGTSLVFLTPAQAAHADQAAAAIAQRTSSNDWQALLEANLPPIGGPIVRPLYSIWQTRPLNVPAEMEVTLPPILPSILTSDGQWIASSTVGGQEVYVWPPIDSVVDENHLLTQAEIDLGKLGVAPETVMAALAQRKAAPFVINPFISAMDLNSVHLPPQTRMLPSLGRYYPNGTLYAHLIGGLQLNRRPSLTGPPQKDEVFYASWEGTSGLEGLAGKSAGAQESGTLRITSDPFGYAQAYTVTKPVAAAPVLTTTLDQGLQQALHAALAPVGSGEGVVLDSDDGSVVALVSKPDFDPNALLGGNSNIWQELSNAPGDPLLNKATQFQGPPGSTFKVVTSLVALRSGALQTGESIPLGSIALSGVNFNFPKENGSATFQEALAQSRDSYFMRVGLRVGPKALVDGAREVGLGGPSGFPLGEASGLVPDDAFMVKHHQRNLGQGDAANLSIGQGDLTVTPIQMAVLYGALANGGTRWKPHLWLDDTPVAQGQVDLPPGVAQAIMAGLHEVTIDGTGTAAHVEGYDTWGKTGTAQVGTKDLPRQLGWFCGGFTVKDRHYVAAILTEGTTDELIYGGGTSAVVFGQMIRNWKEHKSDPAKLQIVKATGTENDDSIPVAPVASEADIISQPDLPTTGGAASGPTPGVILTPDVSEVTAPRALPADEATGEVVPRAIPVAPDESAGTNASPQP